ncbi:hypothetical protein EON63_23995 [archaeon]|nr:MAG: hypothetical protein EON63_23995 [archaeon]
MARSTRPASSVATSVDMGMGLGIRASNTHNTASALPPAPPTGRFDVKDINLSASTASLSKLEV